MTFTENMSVKSNDYYLRLEVDSEDGGEYIDHWHTGELLFLASSVQRSDRNWVSVARGLKLYGEQTRPADFYTPKNCALQYTKLLSEVDEDSKKKTLPRTERETSEAMLVKNLTDKRLNELSWLNQQTKSAANVLKTYVEMVENGDFDDQLDELLKNMDDKEKREEEKYVEYISKRETLNATKKLNKSRLAKGKASKVIDSKKKQLQYSDIPEDSPGKATVLEVVKNIKKEIEEEELAHARHRKMKSELDANKSLNALLDSKITMPTSAPPTSPLLTSLLRTITSTSSGSQSLPPLTSTPIKENIKVEETSHTIVHCSIPETSTSKKIDVFITPTSISSTSISPLLTSLLKSAIPLTPISTSIASQPKKSDHSESMDHSKSEMEIGEFMKSKEASPRGSVPQSPRPTPSSSPLLNSLLKNSPSSSIMSSKDVSPKAVSSPQPFFNPSSVLASAAAQQLAVATSTQSLSHQFFPHELTDSRKVPFQSSPVTSACLSAPTLSKLLEMPPSTPGRLPPLPVLDPPLTPASVTSSPLKSSSHQLINEVKLSLPEYSPTKKNIDRRTSEVQQVAEAQNIVTSPMDIDTKVALVSDAEGDTVEVKSETTPGNDSDDISKKNLAILDEMCESFQAVIKKEEIDEQTLDKTDEDSSAFFCVDTKQNITIKKEIPSFADSTAADLLDAIKIENIEDSPEGDINPDIGLLAQIISGTDDDIDNLIEAKSSDGLVEEKETRKIFKSRPCKKTTPAEDDCAPKTGDTGSSSTLVVQSIKTEIKIEIEESPNKIICIKKEPESPVSSKNVLSHETEEVAKDKVIEQKSVKGNEVKSPVSKKPRLLENISSEKQDLSEDEAPSSIRRSGRKSKKNRGRGSKLPPLKPIEPKDQYEFTESAEENSVGYQTSNALCYGPRLKEGSRFDDKTKRTSQDLDDSAQTPSTDSPIAEKKFSPPVKKSKSPFATDEDAVSDSVSDDASNSLLTEDKLKKWDESTEKKSDALKVSESIKNLQKHKTGESSKKKHGAKRHLLGKSISSNKKERKLTGSDFDELSACSRDSEDVSNIWKGDKENADQKDQKSNIPVDIKAETTDSRMSSSVTAESEPMDDIESLQGSITTEFSPLPVSEIKDEKDTSQFGKQDWFHGVSPKSSEHVSQSSEESEEYESDNWDNQSVSTNKSASHSSGPQPRTKRKERESAQYKAWKKAIHIVLREASCHKYANVFLQKVTNDVAPGYSSIVYRPMDLSLIKKNIDNGVVKTTEEFHRDMLLMFQNAIMYNSSDHDVYKMAVEMQQDVIQQIKAFLTTQYNDKDQHNEPTSSLRGARVAKSQKAGGKQPSATVSTPKGKEDSERD